jgi:hypothetical protein
MFSSPPYFGALSVSQFDARMKQHKKFQFFDILIVVLLAMRKTKHLYQMAAGMN